jgi:hypothetical protein
VLARLLPPHPAPGRAGGRGVAAVVRAMLAGPHALSQGGRRREARGLGTLRQPGLTRASRNAARLGHLLEAWLAAHRPTVCGALARKALEG